MFVQLSGWSWGGAGYTTPGCGRGRQTLSGVRFPTGFGPWVNCLTLMHMVTVGFLTVVIGHVG
jgi:hypothetical protein